MKEYTPAELEAMRQKPHVQAYLASATPIEGDEDWEETTDLLIEEWVNQVFTLDLYNAVFRGVFVELLDDPSDAYYHFMGVGESMPGLTIKMPRTEAWTLTGLPVTDGTALVMDEHEWPVTIQIFSDEIRVTGHIARFDIVPQKTK